MAIHIGKTIIIASPNMRGMINDHVEVRSSAIETKNKDKYTAYARTGYNIGEGPKEYREHYARGRSKRSWSKIDTLCQDVPLDEAIRAGNERAQESFFHHIYDFTTPLFNKGGFDKF